MSTKPVAYAQWDSNGTNVSAVTAGHKTDGYATDEVPTSAEWNAHFKLIGEWTQWLLDGELGDLTFDNITVTGATTFTGSVDYSLTGDITDWDPAGTGSTSDIHTIRVTSDGLNDHAIYGLVGGVDGRELQIINVGAAFFTVANDLAATAANRFLMPAYFNPELVGVIRVMPEGCIRLRYDGASSRWRVVEATGCMTYRRMVIPAAAAVTGMALNGNDVASEYGQGHIVLDRSSESDAIAYYPVMVPVGSVIDGWVLYVNKLSSNATTITATLSSRENNSGTGSTIGVSDTDNGNATGYGAINNNLSGLEHTVTEDAYYILVHTDDATATKDHILNADVYTWVPL